MNVLMEKSNIGLTSDRAAFAVESLSGISANNTSTIFLYSRYYVMKIFISTSASVLV